MEALPLLPKYKPYPRSKVEMRFCFSATCGPLTARTTFFLATDAPVYTLDMQNRFYLWLYSCAKPVQLDWNHLPPDLPATDLRYFLGIFKHLDHLLTGAGMTFVLTWHLDAFHEVMQDAVIFLIGDEQYQMPSYLRHVRALFKTGGLQPNPLRDTLGLPWPVAWRALLRDARNLGTRMRRRWRYGPSGKVATLQGELPLGYFQLCDAEPKPVNQRPVDVFFAGVQAASGWTLRASVAARKQMAAGLAAAQAALPQYRFESWLAAFASGRRLNPEEYTQALSNAKIALAPRGNFDETFRLFEAAKLGCVIVSDPLPRRWYYQNCPLVSIHKWSALPDVLKDLLADPAKLAELSLRTRQWWDTVLSKDAVAKYIIEQLTNGKPAAMRKCISSSAGP